MNHYAAFGPVTQEKSLNEGLMLGKKTTTTKHRPRSLARKKAGIEAQLKIRKQQTPPAMIHLKEAF